MYYELRWFPLSVILIEGVFSNTGPLENNKRAYWALLKKGAFKISTPQERTRNQSNINPEDKFGEEQRLLSSFTSNNHKEDKAEVAMDSLKFAETLSAALPIPDTTFTPFEFVETKPDTPTEGYQPTTTTTEDNVELGHDAFLLEIPQQPGDTEHHYVLALPEVQSPEEDEMSEVSSAGGIEEHFPMLERAMSMIPTQLPTDITDVQIAATEVEVGKMTTELHLDMVVKRQVPVVGYVILISGFFAMASVGTALDLQGHAVSPTMKTFWRLSSTALLLFPLAANSMRREGLPKLTQTQWIMFPLAALAYGQMVTAFVIALSMTSLANSFVLSNLTSLFLITGKIVMGVPIVYMEVFGATIGFTGAAICAGDTSGSEAPDEDSPHSTGNEMLGNLIATSASLGMVVYLTVAKDLRASCDLYIFMFVIMLLASVFLLAYMILSGEYITFSMDHNHGIFGWILPTPDRLPLELYMVLSCNFLGTMGYVAVLKYFDSVVIATIMLMEPVVAAFIQFWVGLDGLPGTQTWIGDAIVTIGSALVIYSGSKKTEHIDATKAVRPRLNTMDIHKSVVSIR